jgi:rhodanese-related sulfurtransferase
MLQSVPKDRVILIYCDGGECELSHHVADVLKRFAYGPIFIYTGGWAEWTTKK